MSVIVLGMHRSGTSALTRSLNLMGLSVGREEDLLPANEENPRGFWENSHLTELNEEILEAMGGQWQAPPDLHGPGFEQLAGWWRDDRLRDLRTAGRELLEQGGMLDGHWCWKDPRNCLTLPFWLELLPRTPAVVFIRRNPLEVWRSLERRNALSKRHALGLWYVYSTTALTQLDGLPCCTVDYASLLAEPVAVLGRVCAFLDRHGIGPVHEPTPELLGDFLARDLKHWQYDERDMAKDPDVHVRERELSEYLNRLPAEFDSLPGPPPVDRSHVLGSLVVAHQAQNVEHREQIEGIRQHLANTEEELATATVIAEDDAATAARIDRAIRERVSGTLAQVGGRVPNGITPRGDDAPCDVLIPIYNAFDHVTRCVESVLRYTAPHHRIVLLDDASPDPRITPLLEAFAGRDSRIELRPAERNLGFIGNVNRGFNLSRGDVVVLNSDTEVTPGWLERMQRCLESDPALGIVSPLSNNATILSVPIMNAKNELPEGMTSETLADLVARCSATIYPRIPTAVGFCMLIRRAALDRLGHFDPAYGRGYGEECDFCMRAWQSGIEVACCDDAYVHHHGEASFGEVGENDERFQRSQRLLDMFWPRYHRAVYGFCHLNPMREVGERVATAIRRWTGERQEGPLPHVLQIVHSFDVPGGTELHTAQMIQGLAGRYRSTVLFPDAQPGVWADMVSEERDEGLRVIRLCRENVVSNEFFVGQAAGLEAATVENNFARMLAGSDVDVVHFQHLAGWGTLHLPFIAKALGKRVVLSLHDYFLLCPEYNLVDPDMRRCGKLGASSRDEDCFRCLGEKRYVNDEDRQVQLHTYLADRREIMRRIIEEADALVSPSTFVRDQFVRAFGDWVGEKIHMIPHGMNVREQSPRPEREDVLRVGFLGNMSDRKGGLQILQTAELLRNKAVRFTVFGGVPPALVPSAQRQGMSLHGPYRHEELPGLLEQIDLVVIPSVWDETFCLTVSEAQAMGVPVIASDVGAISERIEDGRTGFLVPPSDPEALAARLMEIAADRRALERVAGELRGMSYKTLDENVEDYADLYGGMIHAHDRGGHLLRAMLGVDRQADSPAPISDEDPTGLPSGESEEGEPPTLKLVA